MTTTIRDWAILFALFLAVGSAIAGTAHLGDPPQALVRAMIEHHVTTVEFAGSPSAAPEAAITNAMAQNQISR